MSKKSNDDEVKESRDPDDDYHTYEVVMAEKDRVVCGFCYRGPITCNTLKWATCDDVNCRVILCNECATERSISLVNRFQPEDEDGEFILHLFSHWDCPNQ